MTPEAHYQICKFLSTIKDEKLLIEMVLRLNDYTRKITHP